MQEKPELIFGLVGAIGTELEMVQSALQTSLSNVGYNIVEVKLSELMRQWTPMPLRTEPDYYDRAMSAGNDIRKAFKRQDAIAGLAIAFIRKFRDKRSQAGKLNEGRAYVIISLKRREEIELLRNAYGAAFFVVSAYAPRSTRVDRLASLLASKTYTNRAKNYRSDAERLIKRDEEEDLKHGQDVRKTYPLGDLFVTTSSVDKCEKEVWRFISLIFGELWHTPTRDEQGMAFAFLASLRSGSPARQVGAALTDASGNIKSVGMNDVAAPRGGQYWEGHDHDGRDVFYAREDQSDHMRNNVLADVLERLRTLELLKCDPKDQEKLREETTQAYLREAQLFDTIDYVRAVHAEASALLSAQGSTRGSYLYVTTFPCHECARHIVFAGIERVIYVEPYPKSLVLELYKDSIAVDPRDEQAGKVNFIPFTGISPASYQHLFSMANKRRKGKDGKLVKWNAAEAVPRLHISYSQWATDTAEMAILDEFGILQIERGATSGDTQGDF